MWISELFWLAKRQSPSTCITLCWHSRPTAALLLLLFALWLVPTTATSSESEALSDEIDPALDAISPTVEVRPLYQKSKNEAPQESAHQTSNADLSVTQDQEKRPTENATAQTEATKSEEQTNDQTSSDIETPKAKTSKVSATETDDSETESPETESPETESPETESPETDNPETDNPETQSPDTATLNKNQSKQAKTQENTQTQIDQTPKELETTSNSSAKKSPHVQNPETSTPTSEVIPEPLEQKPLHLLGTEIPPGLATRVAWRPGHSLKGLASQAPVLIVHGKNPGPTLCIAAAVHGDELNGIEVVRQVLHKVKAHKLRGTLIGVPIVNIQGFLRNSRYLVDRRDLNRFFPGNPHGSLASRIAYSFFNQVILNCSALVDVHTGSFYRDNLPQLRADLSVPSVVQLTEGFGSTLVLNSSGARGTLRKAAVTYNIPAVTLELGGPMILDAGAVEHGVEGIFNLLDSLDMYTKNSFWGTPKPVYYQSLWVRAENGGIFFSKVKLGDHISPGDTLGTITNPITNEQFILVSPHEGEVVGLAHNQVVYPGFATTHLAIKPTEAVPIPQSSENKMDRMENDE